MVGGGEEQYRRTCPPADACGTMFLWGMVNARVASWAGVGSGDAGSRLARRYRARGIGNEKKFSEQNNEFPPVAMAIASERTSTGSRWDGPQSCVEKDRGRRVTGGREGQGQLSLTKPGTLRQDIHYEGD